MFSIPMNKNTPNGNILIANNHTDYVQLNKVKSWKKILINGNSTIKRDIPLEDIKNEIDPTNFDDIVNVSNRIRDLANLKKDPTIGIICGSGLGDLADRLTEPRSVIPYDIIPGFKKPHVAGHKGNLVFGYLGSTYIMCLQGRFHPYEHHMNLVLCSMPVRIMHQLGVKTLIVSNAAGGVNPKFTRGDLMLIRDHIFMPGLCGFSPLTSLKDPRFGSLFVSLHDAYDKDLRSRALKVAAQEGIKLKEGVYVMNSGPQYETPSEVNLFQTIGGDALGMSTCHEVTVARQCKMKVLGFSLITNICNLDVDNALEVSHAEVLDAAKLGSLNAIRFISALIRNLEKEQKYENNENI